jgi:hypothetical protein
MAWIPVASDDFNRSDGPLGTNWTTLVSPPPEISSQQVEAGGSTSWGEAYWNGDVPNNDQYVQIKCTNSADSEHYVGILLRLGDIGSGGDWYELYTDAYGDTELVRIDNGEETSLGSLTDPDNGDTIALEAVDDDLQYYINGSPSGSPITDGTYSSGYCGISAGWGTQPNGDDWVCGNVGAAVTLEQEGYRWYDDGTESGSSPRQDQDTVDTVARALTVQIRTLLNATGDPDSIQYLLEYKETSDPDSEYRAIPAG